MRFAYPLMLDVTGRLVVIIGGGAVAVRKATGLLEAGATRVRVVAPRIDAAMPAAVERVNEAYDERYLEGATLVFAATDSPDVNEQVARDAKARGALVNRADESEASDFVTPAAWRQGGVALTVTAGSPTLAVAIRDDLVAMIDERQVRMSELMSDLRPRIRDSSLDAASRAAVFRDLAGAEALAVLAADGDAGLRNWINARYPRLKL